MRLKWILLSLSAAALLPILLLAFALLYLHVADLSEHRETIAREASKLAGRDISFNGDLDIDLSLSPSIVVSEVAVANADWASAPHMLTVGRFEAAIELLPLLRGAIHIPHLYVDGIRASLETDQAGTGNWILQTADGVDQAEQASAPPAKLQLPWFGDLNIADVELVYHDGQTGRQIASRLEHARISADDPKAPTVLDIVGLIDGEPFEVNGTVALPGVFARDSIHVPLELHAAILDLTLDAGGLITGTADSPGIQLNVEAAATDLNRMRSVFGDVIPVAKPVQLDIKVEGDPGRPVAFELNAVAGKGVLDAQMILHRGGPRPVLSGEVKLDDLDVTTLWANLLADRPGEDDKADSNAPTNDATALGQAIDLAWLGQFDADVSLAANNIKLPQLRIKALQGRFLVDDRRLVLDETKLDTDAGSADLELELNARGRQPQISLALDTTEIVFGKLEPLAKNPNLRDSTASASFALKAQGSTAIALIHSFEGEAKLDYANRKLKDELTLSLLRRGGESGTRPLDVNAEGRIQGHAVKLYGNIVPPADLLQGVEPFDVKLALQALGVTAKVDGTVASALDGGDLGILASANDLSGLKPLLGEAVPVVGKTELQAQLKLEPSQLRLTPLKVKLGDSRIDGWLVLNTSASVPELRTELDIVDLNLDTLMPPAEKPPDAKPPSKSDGDRVLSNEPLPFDAFARIDIQATLRATNLVRHKSLLKQAGVNINLSGGKLSASLSELSSAHGELLADVEIDARNAKNAGLSVNFKAARIELGELLTTTEGEAAIEGPLAVDISLKGRGNSVAQIAGSLNGKVKLLIEEGRADARALDMFVGGLGAMVGTIFTEQSSKSEINCAICDLKIDKGLVDTQLAVLDTQYSTVFIDGRVNLKDEKLDLKVSPDAKGVTLSVAFPVLVRGTMAKPNIDVEKKGALLKTGELWATVAYPPTALLKFNDLMGDGKENPCVTMVAEKGGIPILEDVGKAVKGTVKATGKVVEGTVEGTEKVVKGTVEGTEKVVKGTVKGAEKAVKGVGGALKGDGLRKLFKKDKESADPAVETGAEEETEEDDFDMDY